MAHTYNIIISGKTLYQKRVRVWLLFRRTHFTTNLINKTATPIIDTAIANILYVETVDRVKEGANIPIKAMERMN